MRALVAALVTCAACGGGNDLAPPGVCTAAGGATPVAEPIQLVTGATSFDDLHYAPSLDKVVAAPAGAEKIFLIDPDDNTIITIADRIAPGTASADAVGALVFAVDRGGRRIEVVDVVLEALVGEEQLADTPDYIRASPMTNEVWVTFPGADRIDTFATSATPPSATKTGSIDVASPEGLAFDGAGRAYTNSGGKLVQIDVATRSIVDTWSTGCDSSHGFPQVDTALGLAVSGCGDNGGAGVVASDSGAVRSGIEAGGGPAILAYDQTLHHLYLRGDGSPTLLVIGVCSDGGLAELARVAIPENGHGAAADGNGHAWVVDPDHGGIVRIVDPFPPSS